MDILIAADAVAAVPEIFLAVAVMVLLMLGAFWEKNNFETANTLSLLVLALTAALILFWGNNGDTAFNGAYVIDSFARLMKVLTLFGCAVAIVLSVHFMKLQKIDRFEYPLLVLLAALGMMIMISARDLIALYMGLELQALALYVAATINRDSARSSEAGLKYFVLGALSSGMLLYGCSLIYGFTGSVDFTTIAGVLKQGGVSLGLTFGLVFLIAGMAFKVSAVPFHMWTPDVYEGAPTPVTAFFASAPKIAAMAMFMRAILEPFPAIASDWQQIIVFISIASMLLGAFAAIGQTNIKRLLAYSSIGHMGYALIGLAAAGNEAARAEGVRGMVIYLIIYLIMTMGSFACVLMLRRKENNFDDIVDLAGLGRHHPRLAFALLVLMFSLAGIPPLAGFFSKYYIFLAAIRADLIWLAIIGVISSVVGAFYYLRIVKIMYFDEPEDSYDPAPMEIRLVASVATLFVLGFYVISKPIVGLAQAAVGSLL